MAEPTEPRSSTRGVHPAGFPSVAGGPALVVADEPTAELDSEAGERLMRAVLALRDQGTSLVLSSHDPVVTGAVDQVVRLHDGEVS